MKLDASGVDFGCERPPEDTFAGWMHLPAPRAAKLIVDFVRSHPTGVHIPLYKYYGQDWLDTITNRAKLCTVDDLKPDSITDLSMASALLEKFVK